MGFEEVLESAVFVFLVLFAIGYGFLSGLETTTLGLNLFIISVSVYYLDSASTIIGFSGFILVTGMIYLKGIYINKKGKAIENGGDVLAIIPVYKDSHVLQNSVESLKNTDYKADVDIVVVCEGDDKEAIDLTGEMDDVKSIINSNPGSKAGAINTAFNRFDYDFYAVFDADQVFEPDFIPRAIGYIESGYDAFEARKIPDVTGWVEALSYCERILTRIAYSFTQLSGFKTLGSSSVVMKKKVLEETGGYSEDMLTEDVDFHHKAYRAGFDVAHDYQVVSVMEAPHSLSDFWNQRKRWRIGWMQILIKTVKGKYDNYWSRRGVVSTIRPFLGLIAAISIIFLVPKIIILLLIDSTLFYTTPMIILVGLVSIVSYWDARHDKTEFLGVKAILAPVAVIMIGLIALKAVTEYLITWKGEWYSVEKKGESH